MARGKKHEKTIITAKRKIKVIGAKVRKTAPQQDGGNEAKNGKGGKT